MKHQRAYAFLDKITAGTHRKRYELEMRAFAKRSGYDLARTIIEDGCGRGISQLVGLVTNSDDSVVIVPSLDHLIEVPDTRLEDLTDFAEVLTMYPNRRWTRPA